MDILHTDDIRMLDHRAIHDFHIPSIILMEHAARALKQTLDTLSVKGKCIHILCGPGNNGGDGFALATLLQQAGYENITLVCMCTMGKMSEDERYYAKKAQALMIPIVSTWEDLLTYETPHVIVDALFGTGLTREISGTYATWIHMVNAMDAFVISADIPSGIDSETGCCLGCAIKANMTITFANPQPGHVLNQGRIYCGELRCVDIKIPEAAYAGMERIPILDDTLVQRFLPQRLPNTHKGSYGKVLLIGGSVSMHGAITLCAKSMLKSGVGTLTLMIPHDIVPILAMKMEECMLVDAPSENGYFGKEAGALLTSVWKDYDLLVIGNGMGRQDACHTLIEIVLRSDKPCVIDGDGIFLCAQHMDLLKQRKAMTILTPHPKEMSYLSSNSVANIIQNPFKASEEFLQQYPNTVLVLKDMYTTIRSMDSCYFNMAGNNALAKGGSGDVLCGIIAGLFAQSHEALESAAAGVYVHARCSDLLVQHEDENSILPSDLIAELSHIYKSIRCSCNITLK